ncbi:MAG: hypothetical protein ACRD2D_10845, partial [Terriglobales bacterium]
MGSPLWQVRRWLAGALWLGRRQREMKEELQFHLELRAEEEGRGGPATHGRFGNELRLREEMLDADGLGWLSDWVRDTRIGLRLLRRSPGFATAAILTLAIGIGANAAVY